MIRSYLFHTNLVTVTENENKKKKQLFKERYKENKAIEQFFFPACQVEINKCKLHS